MTHHGKAPTQAEGRSPYPELPEAAIEAAARELAAQFGLHIDDAEDEDWDAVVRILQAFLSALSTSDLLSLVEMSDEEREELAQRLPKDSGYAVSVTQARCVLSTLLGAKK